MVEKSKKEVKIASDDIVRLNPEPYSNNVYANMSKAVQLKDLLGVGILPNIYHLSKKDKDFLDLLNTWLIPVYIGKSEEVKFYCKKDSVDKINVNRLKDIKYDTTNCYSDKVYVAHKPIIIIPDDSNDVIVSGDISVSMEASLPETYGCDYLFEKYGYVILTGIIFIDGCEIRSSEFNNLLLHNPRLNNNSKVNFKSITLDYLECQDDEEPSAYNDYYDFVKVNNLTTLDGASFTIHTADMENRNSDFTKFSLLELNSDDYGVMLRHGSSLTLDIELLHNKFPCDILLTYPACVTNGNITSLPHTQTYYTIRRRLYNKNMTFVKNRNILMEGNGGISIFDKMVLRTYPEVLSECDTLHVVDVTVDIENRGDLIPIITAYISACSDPRNFEKIEISNRNVDCVEMSSYLEYLKKLKRTYKKKLEDNNTNYYQTKYLLNDISTDIKTIKNYLKRLPSITLY